MACKLRVVVSGGFYDDHIINSAEDTIIIEGVLKIQTVADGVYIYPLSSFKFCHFTQEA